MSRKRIKNKVEEDQQFNMNSWEWIIYYLKVFVGIEDPKSSGILVKKEKVHWVYGLDLALSKNDLRIEVHFFLIKLIVFLIATTILFYCSVDFIDAFNTEKIGGLELLKKLLFVEVNQSFSWFFPKTSKTFAEYLSENNLYEYAKYRLYFAVLLSLVPTFLLSKSSLVPKTGYKIGAGMPRFTGKEAWKIFNKRYNGSELFFGTARVLAQLWNTGAVMLGMPGSGKTTIVAPLIFKFFKKNMKILVLDIKGDYLKRMPKTGFDYVIAPWLLSQTSAVWDIASDINTVDKAKQFAAVVFPVSGGKDSEIWDSAARIILSAATSLAMQREPKKYRLSSIGKILENEKQELIKLLGFDKNAVAILSAADATSDSVVFTYQAKVLEAVGRLGELFDEQLKLGAKKFSISEWATNKKYNMRQIFISYSEQFPIISDFLMRSIVDYFATLVGSMQSNSGEKKVLVLDEITQLKKVATLEKIPAIGREKDIILILAYQLQQQMKEIYGENQANSIYANIGIKLVGKISNGEVAEATAKTLGQIEIRYWDETESEQGGIVGSKKGRSGSQKTETRQAYLGSELQSRLGISEQKVIGFKIVHGKKAYVYRPTKVRALIVLDAYYELDFDVEDFRDVKRGLRSLPATFVNLEYLHQIVNSKREAKAIYDDLFEQIKSKRGVADYLRSVDAISEEAFKTADEETVIKELTFKNDSKTVVEVVADTAKESAKTVELLKEMQSIVDVQSHDVSETALLTVAAAAVDTLGGLLTKAEAPEVVTATESKDAVSDEMMNKIKKLKAKKESRSR